MRLHQPSCPLLFRILNCKIRLRLRVINLIILRLHLTQVLHLLLEDIISSLIIHLLLLPRVVPHSSNVDLILLMLWCITPQMPNHGPPGQIEEILLSIPHVEQLLLDHLLLELSQICISSGDSARVLNGWVQVHPVLTSSMQTVR